jgi:glycosyltransferase involved in cell wall biosynthesis
MALHSAPATTAITAPSLIWLSDSPTLSTGYARVGQQVLPWLAETFPGVVTCLGWGYQQSADDKNDRPYELFAQGTFESPQDNLPRLLASRPGAVLVTLGDPWSFDPIARLKTQHDFSWLAYVPTDCAPLPRKALLGLLAADAVVAASYFGKSALEQALPEVEVGVVYHGVDCAIFRPLENRSAVRAENGLADRFVVGFVGRNRPRKQLACLIKAFARFTSECPEAFLYLHTTEEPDGWDVPGLLARYGLDQCAGITGDLSIKQGLTDEMLNLVYNLFDVFVLPSCGEGFGLPIVEAMAAGVPVVTTDHSTNKELVKGRGLLISPLTFITAPQLNAELPLPDEGDLAAKLTELYRDEALRDECSRLGLAYARDLSWRDCGSGLVSAIRRIQAASDA